MYKASIKENTENAMFQENLKPRLTDTISQEAFSFNPENKHVIGFCLGEGVGPEVVPVAMKCLEVLSAASERNIEIQQGGLIGYPALEKHGNSLSDDLIQFTQEIFDQQGALFCGPGGERFVYETRRVFDLFCKFTPLQPFPELASAGVLKPDVTRDVDIIAVRENLGGIYQGEWSTVQQEDGQRKATHTFHYTDEMVHQILLVAMKLAKTRKNRVHIVTKPGGIPTITQLWREHAENLASEMGVELFELEVDNAAYQLIANPSQFDVLTSPNLFGDVLADNGSLLLATRGLSFSGNFNAKGNAIYQTGHGAARDIAGKGIANPAAQVLSLGMMLRESFNWPEADAILRQSIRDTYKDGFTTQDIPMLNHKVLGTQDFEKELIRNLRTNLEGISI